MIHKNKDGFCWLIVTDNAQQIFDTGLFNLYTIYEDDTESLLNNDFELHVALANGEKIGIEVGHTLDIDDSLTFEDFVINKTVIANNMMRYGGSFVILLG